MKKSILILIMLSSCLLLCSCAIGADQMLEEFNGEIVEGNANNNLNTKEKVHVAPQLIPRKVYPVKAGYTLRLVVNSAFHDYRWSLKDNTTGADYNIDGYYIVYVGRPEINFMDGHEYTLTLFARNRNNVLFTDTATLKVVK